MCEHCHVVTAKSAITNREALKMAAADVGASYTEYYNDLSLRFPWGYRPVNFAPDGNYTGDADDLHFHAGQLGHFLQLASKHQDRLLAPTVGHTLLSERVLPDGTIEVLYDDGAEQLNQLQTVT